MNLIEQGEQGIHKVAYDKEKAKTNWVVEAAAVDKLMSISINVWLKKRNKIAIQITIFKIRNFFVKWPTGPTVLGSFWDMVNYTQEGFFEVQKNLGTTNIICCVKSQIFLLCCESFLYSSIHATCS